MSDNVVTFKPRDERVLIWACACGSTAHHHHADGSVVCASCENVASGTSGEWRERLPDVPDEAKPLNGDNFKVIDLTGPEPFLRRRLADNPENIVAALIVQDDGGVSTFFRDIDTEERRAWLRRKLDEAFARIAQA